MVTHDVYIPGQDNTVVAAALRAAHKRGMVEGLRISGEQLKQFGDDISAMATEIEAKP